MANAGTSKAVVLREIQQGSSRSFEMIRVSETHHALVPKELEKAKKNVPKGTEAVAFGKLLGKIRATRGLGNFWLKNSNMAYKYDAVSNNHEAIKGFKKAIISSEPDINVIDLQKKDRWLILATDGMWENVKRRDIAQLVSQVDIAQQDESDSVHVVRHLLNTALERICYNEGITRTFLSDCQPGQRKR